MGTEKAAFMGMITAGVAHDINNVLAIIKESAGLIEDIMTFGKKDSPLPQEKLFRTLSRITEQVVRGVDLASNLNTFAHIADEPLVDVDLNRTVDQVAFLCRRFARLKYMTLEALPQDKALVVSTDPLMFQMLLFRCVDLIMNRVEPGTVITLQPNSDNGNGILISTKGQKNLSDKGLSKFDSESDEWQAVQVTAAALNMSVQSGCPPLWISVIYQPRQG